MGDDLEPMEALLSKYREIVRLRREAAAGIEAQRETLVSLAHRFPGSLRELDRLPPEVLNERVDVLQSVIMGAEPAPLWARQLALYHAWLRVALWVRARFKKHDDPSDVLAGVKSGPLSDNSLLRDRVIKEAWVVSVFDPPKGRLSLWAARRVGEALSCESSEVLQNLG